MAGNGIRRPFSNARLPQWGSTEGRNTERSLHCSALRERPSVSILENCIEKNLHVSQHMKRPSLRVVPNEVRASERRSE